MQAARIWFQKPVPPLTLSQVKEHLQGMGIEANDTEWRSGGYLVPQLHVTSPANFITQLEDEAWIIDEAEEIAQLAPALIRDRLSVCDARLSFGGAHDENSITTDQGAFAIAGWTNFDPGEPKVKILLEALARMVDGVFEDNTTGTWWVPT